MFEQASKLKLRFNTVRGDITTEDLWDMPLTSKNGFNLDNLAKSLNMMVKESGETSFVQKKSAVDSILELKFSIVKHVIKVLLDAAEARANASAAKVKREKILGIIAAKEDESLKGESVENLKKMLETL